MVRFRWMLLLLASCAHEPGLSPTAPSTDAPPVQWQSWSAETFARAKQERRFLLVSVQAIWCHWCHVMNDETYTDPVVRRQLAENFVAIKVDSDERPDLADRFRDYGWPATALLTPDAELVVALRGHRPANVFAPLLAQVAAGERPAEPEPEPAAIEADLETLRAKARERLDELYDENRGGWGFRQKYPYAAPLEHAFFRAEALGEQRWRGRALATLEGYAQLIDPVDGGVYQYSLRHSWDHPHFERIAAVQGGALAAFAEAARLTGEPRWVERMGKVRAYIDGVLGAPGGGWYASQDADLNHDTPGAEYFALDADGRAALGTPRVDPHVYVDRSAQILVGMIAAARAGDQEALSSAMRAGEALEAARGSDDLFVHELNVEPGPVRYLLDQAWMLRAELLLHEATGDKRWRERGVETAGAIERHLHREVSEGGGFYAHTPDPAAAGIFAERRVPLNENGVSARGLLHLSRLTNDERWMELAKSALRSQSPATIRRAGRRGGDYLLALEELLGPYVLLSIVGPDDDATAELHRAAFELPLPHRLVELDRPGEGRYPFPGRSAVFLCNESACSMPVSEPSELAAQASAIVEAR